VEWIFFVFVVLVLCFGLVVFFGPPYLPTLTPQMNLALDMLQLKKGDTMLELGCGDGRVLIAAAKRGWNVVGYELNPLLALLCRIRTWRYRRHVRVVWGNFWLSSWPPADGIFGFVLPRYMTKLDKRIVQWHTKPVRLASFAFAISDRKPLREGHGVFLYEYL
jgi:hypothetical protein